jgi:mxaC protein
MPAALDFNLPWLLLLAPLALLPLLRQRADTLSYSYLPWLPADRAGRLMGALWRAMGVLALLATIVALAGPGLPETQVLRTGRGAEILVLMDRSRSMDERMLPADWRNIDPLLRRHQARSRGPQKGQVARELLSKFVAQRPDDRFSLMFFSTRPLHVVPFTQRDEVVQAGIAAAGVGRGLADTDMARAIQAAIKEFEGRAYTGSRIILLVSDGAARLDDETQAAIASGLQRNRITLNWIYLRSVNSPLLDSDAAESESTPEIGLHRFFKTLRTPYAAYQAESEEELTQAVEDVGRQQNYPLDYFERVPRHDLTRHCLVAAALACLALVVFRALLLRRWR